MQKKRSKESLIIAASNKNIIVNNLMLNRRTLINSRENKNVKKNNFK